MRTSTHSVRRSLVLAAIVIGLAAPAASAAPVQPVDLNQDRQSQAAAYSVPPLEFSSPPAPASGSSQGFDWGDAGIGATAVLALAAIAAGAAAAVGHRPRRGHTAS